MYRSDKSNSWLLTLVFCTMSIGVAADVFAKRVESSFDADTISVIGYRVADWQISEENQWRLQLGSGNVVNEY